MNDQATAMVEQTTVDEQAAQSKITPESLKALNPIIINERAFKHAGASLYRVYTAPGEFNMVEAESAHEAFAKSGLDSVFKIERETFYRYVSLEPNLVEEKEGNGVAIDTNLPNPEEMHTLLTAALSDLTEPPTVEERFEGMTLGDLGKDEEATAERVAPEAEEMPAVEPTAEPAAEAPVEAAAVEPEPESAEELSSDEVDALLNDEE